MYVLRKIQGDLNKVACDVQCYLNDKLIDEYRKENDV